MTGIFGGGPKPIPPPPPPPPANPPTFASASAKAPFMQSNPFLTGLGNSVLTSPSGVPNDPSIIGKKTLLGQ